MPFGIKVLINGAGNQAAWLQLLLPAGVMASSLTRSHPGPSLMLFMTKLFPSFPDTEANKSPYSPNPIPGIYLKTWYHVCHFS